MSSAVGRRVVVTGLQSNTALNGSRGVVTQGPNELGEPDQYIVHMDGVGERRFLSKNLELEETEEEQLSMDKYRRHKITGEIAVIIDGLKESIHLNGLLGYVETKVGVDELGEDVYAVRLDKNGDKKQFRARHLHAIPIDHEDYGGGEAEFIDTSNETSLIERLSAEFRNNPDKFKRVVNAVRVQARSSDSICGAFQLTQGITASATPAIETKRTVVKWSINDIAASVIQYKTHVTAGGQPGQVYSKQEGTLSLDEYQSLFQTIVSRVWSLPQLDEEGVDLYGYDIGLAVCLGTKGEQQETWANAPFGAHADAELDDEDGLGVTRDNLDSFKKCISFMSKLVDGTKWSGEKVFIEGKNRPTGAAAAIVDNGESEVMLSGDMGQAIQASPSKNVPMWEDNKPVSRGLQSDHLDQDVLRQLTLAQYKEKAGDVPFDENFVDDDWDLDD